MKKRKKENTKILQWQDFDLDVKKKVAKKNARLAQNRLNKLKRLNMSTYATQEAQAFFDRTKMKTFTTRVEKMSEKEINSYLKELDSFLGYESSTVRGAKKIFNRIYKNANVKVDKGNFAKFLYSEQFRQLIKTIDSDFLLEDVENAMNEGFTIEQIMTSYEKYLMGEMKIDEVQEYREELKNSNKLIKGNR